MNDALKIISEMESVAERNNIDWTQIALSRKGWYSLRAAIEQQADRIEREGFRRCSVCEGTGLSIDHHGEVDECPHCKGNCVEREGKDCMNSSHRKVVIDTVEMETLDKTFLEIAQFSSATPCLDWWLRQYEKWPEDIRRKLSLDDLRRMTGWRPPHEHEAKEQE